MNCHPSQSPISQLKAHQVTTFVFYKIYFNLTEDVHSNIRNDSNDRGQPRARTNRNIHHGRQRQKQASLDLKEMEELRATVKTAKTESNAFKQMAFLFFVQLQTATNAKKKSPVYNISGGQCIFNENANFIGGIFSGGSGLREKNHQRGSQSESQPRLDVDDLD